MTANPIRYASHANQEREHDRQCGQDPLEDHIDHLCAVLDARDVHLPLPCPSVCPVATVLQLFDHPVNPGMGEAA